MKKGLVFFAIIYGELSAVLALVLVSHGWLSSNSGRDFCLTHCSSLSYCYGFVGILAFALILYSLFVLLRLARRKESSDGDNEKT